MTCVHSYGLPAACTADLGSTTGNSERAYGTIIYTPQLGICSRAVLVHMLIPLFGLQCFSYLQDGASQVCLDASALDMYIVWLRTVQRD